MPKKALHERGRNRRLDQAANANWRPCRAAAGFHLPSLATLIAIVIFAALLFVTRPLNRPAPESNTPEVRHSARYLELERKQDLTAAEQAEFELESCRYRRDSIRFLLNKPMANAEGEMAAYRRDCEELLPLAGGTG